MKKSYLSYLILATILILVSCTDSATTTDTDTKTLNGACTYKAYNNGTEQLSAIGNCKILTNTLTVDFDPAVDIGRAAKLKQAVIYSDSKSSIFTFEDGTASTNGSTPATPVTITTKPDLWEIFIDSKLFVKVIAGASTPSTTPNPVGKLNGDCTFIQYVNSNEHLRGAGNCTDTGSLLTFDFDTSLQLPFPFPFPVIKIEVAATKKTVTFTTMDRNSPPTTRSNTAANPVTVTLTDTSWETVVSGTLNAKFILGIDTNIIKNPITSTNITNSTEVAINYVGNHSAGRAFAGAMNQSPHLSWHNVAQAHSSIILAYDITGGNWIHWLRVNIHTDNNSILKGAGSTVDALNGHTSWFTQDQTSEKKYYGPQNPQHGTTDHIYRFAVFGIDQPSITLPTAYTNQAQLTDQLINALGSSPNYNINNKYGTTDENFKIVSIGYIDVTY